jgi:hypothetical protein
MAANQIEPPNREQKSSDDSSQTPPILRPPVQIPQAVMDRYDASQDETRRRETQSTFFQGMTLTIVAAYTVFTYYQWSAMRQSVDQQVLINRPVVFNNGMRSLESEDGVPNKVAVTFRDFGKTVALRSTPFGHLEIGDFNKNAPREKSCDLPTVPLGLWFSTALAPADNGGLMTVNWSAP